ncbi:MAG: Crp/Fnr family transcriptional regulator [Desulfobacterales bacterium]|nr:Crp/Fnr family transcriptional regulator [Desulfobacterales bacterium]
MNKTIASQSILFKELPAHHLEAVLAIAVEKPLEKGALIFSEGEPGNGFYIVVEGQVKIYKLSLEGKEQILHIFGPGEPFGEVPVFSGDVFPASAEAVKKSRVLFFPRRRFIELISADPTLALNMLAVLSRRLRDFTVQIEDLSLKEVPARLAGYLVLLSKEQQNPSEVCLHISKGHLASFLGTIPETLSRILKKMSEKDLIRVNGKKIRLLDYEGLRMLAESGRPGQE